MLKPMQKEPSWSCVLHFIIYLSHFSSLPFRKHVFIKDEHLYHYVIIPFHKPYFNLQENVMGEFLNSYGIIHSFVAFVCCILLKYVTMPWSHFKLVFYFIFKWGTFSNKRDRNTVTESEAFLNKHAPSAFLVFEDETVPFHSRLNHAVREVIY